MSFRLNKSSFVLVIELTLLTTLVWASDPWAEVTQMRDQMRAAWKYHQAVEEDSYFFSSTLCYAFKFSRSHPVMRGFAFAGSPIIASSALGYYWSTDAELRDSIISWSILSFDAIKASFGIETARDLFFFSHSMFADTLVKTRGFMKAIKDCSQELGYDVRPSLVEAIESNQKISSFSTMLIGGGVAGLITKGLIKKIVIRLAPRTWSAVQVSRATAIAMGTIIGGSTIAGARSIFNEISGHKELLTSVSQSFSNDPTVDFDPWVQRRYRLFEFVVNLNKAQEEMTADELMNSLTRGALSKSFGELKGSLPQFKEREKELNVDLSKIDNLPERLNEIISKRDGSHELTPEESDLLLKAQFLGSIRLLTSLVDRLSRVSPRS